MASLLVLPASALAAGNTGPSDAAGPSDGREPLPVGQTNWYEFTYLGHFDFEKDTDGEQRAVFEGTRVEVWLDAEPDDCAVFCLVTEEQVQAWVGGEERRAAAVALRTSIGTAI